MAFRIEPATEADIPTILRFIRELAAFEKLADEVVATEDQLRAALFSDQPVAESLIGRCDERPVAFALFFTSFSTFLGQAGIYLEDLYVTPDYRRRGYGRRLLAHLAALARERGCGRVEWSVLDWNQPAIESYRRVGATPMEQWTVYRLTGEALIRLAGEQD